MLYRQFWSTAFAVAAIGLIPSLPAQAQSTATVAAAPAMQLPPDQAAFNRANASVDPQARATALEAFLHDFPASKRASRARSILLELLVEQQPSNEKRIHQVARAKVDAADKDDRANVENSVAYTLAEAPPNGVDLKSAETWARDAVKQTTLPAVTAMMTSPSKPAKPLTAEEQAKRDATIKEIYADTQASNLQTLADVYLHEGKLDEAKSALAQAQALNPQQGANYLTLGQVEHAEHQDDKALNDLETAVVYGGMTPAGQDLLTSIYSAQHGGDRSGLEAEIDRRYHSLFQPMPVAQHASSDSGRTVLLSLFTGSACEPCVAADLATDAVLQNYPRSQVVALAFDQHIPDPDPLTNPFGVARAAYDNVHFTPTFRIDGIEGPQVGGRRSKAESSYKELSAALDKELKIPSGVTLRLVASITPDHTVSAKAEVEVANADTLQKLLAAKPKAASTAAASSAAAATSTTPAPSQPRLVVNFALVQREVRYSGENGIRFHAMVVRDLAKPAADAFPVALHGSSSAATTFDPAAISTALHQYLTDFANHNERFGAVHFLITDTSLPLDDLAIAAWVEDVTSHQVVAAAYTPLSAEPVHQQASR